MDIAFFQKTSESINRKFFRDLEVLGADEICPYDCKDNKFKNRVSSFFSNHDRFGISSELIYSEFRSDASMAVYFLGWKSLFYFMPSILNISLGSYFDNSEFIYTCENILLNENREIADKTMTRSEWIELFDDVERARIADNILFYKMDFFKKLVNDFEGDFNIWF
jgi:hypothetical protein